jgi:sortase (surface protein transpeptidase)
MHYAIHKHKVFNINHFCELEKLKSGDLIITQRELRLVVQSLKSHSLYDKIYLTFYYGKGSFSII